MSGYYNEYSDDLDRDGGQGESGRGLRKMLEEALGEIRELKSELGKTSRSKSVTELLESKGLDPAVAQIVPEGADPAEWIEQHGSLFKSTGPKLDEDETGELPPAQEETDPDLLAEQEAWEAAHGVSTGTPSTTSSLDPMKQLEDADTPEKVMALIEQATRALPAD